MRFEGSQHNKALAYNLASQLIGVTGADAEMYMRNASRSVASIVVHGFFRRVLSAAAMSYLPIGLFVVPLSMYCGLGFLGGLAWLVPLGFIAFVPCFFRVCSQSRANLALKETLTSLDTAMQDFNTQEREELFLFLRHQGVVNQRLRSAYNEGYNDGFIDGDITGMSLH